MSKYCCDKFRKEFDHEMKTIHCIECRFKLHEIHRAGRYVLYEDSVGRDSVPCDLRFEWLVFLPLLLCLFVGIGFINYTKSYSMLSILIITGLYPVFSFIYYGHKFKKHIKQVVFKRHKC